MPERCSSWYTESERRIRRALIGGLTRRWHYPERATIINLDSNFFSGSARLGSSPAKFHVLKRAVEFEGERAAGGYCGFQTLSPMFSDTPIEGLRACEMCLTALTVSVNKKGLSHVYSTREGGNHG